MRIGVKSVGLENAGAVKKSVLTAIDAGDGIIDLSDVERASSVALSILLSARRRAGERGIRLEIRTPPAGLRLLAHVYGVETLLGLKATDPVQEGSRG